MPPKRQPATPSSPPTLSSGPQTLKPNSSIFEIAQFIWSEYTTSTAQRTKLLDAFLGFLAVLAAVQFVYCVVAGNFPFNAFLSGFSACIGQFVLTVSLRMQTSNTSTSNSNGTKPSSKGKNARFEGEVPGVAEKLGEKGISHERAFADYIFGSVILHFFCINFIN